MTKKVCLLLTVLMLLTSWVALGATFSDVPADNAYFHAISVLSEKGVINGYEDGTFRPDGYITRAEAATMIVRGASLPVTPQKSGYTDLADSHWACGNVMAATEAGIISGMGNGKFEPEGNVTYEQILKMLVCTVGFEQLAEEKGGWPRGYIEAAYQNGIIDSAMRQKLFYTKKGSEPATRRHVADFLYRAKEENSLYINEKTLMLGMSADRLEKPDAVLPSTAHFSWYVYGTDTYKDFYAVGVQDDRIVALTSAGVGFEYLGYRCGDLLPDAETNTRICTDANDDGIVHAVLILNPDYELDYSERGSSTDAQYAGESKMNFHLTNAFRVYHRLKPYRWHADVAETARLHSEDMALNDYFEHTNLQGLSPGDRLMRQGLMWHRYGENIAAGNIRYLGFQAYDAWVNSAPHRQNMLGPCDYLGVGIAFSHDSRYSYYHTQNFYTK